MYEQLRASLASSDASAVGRAFADFAQKLWDGEVDDASLLSLLQDPSNRVRSEVAWAIADAHRPPIGVKWLFDVGLHDRADAVKFWATQCLQQQSLKTLPVLDLSAS